MGLNHQDTKVLMGFESQRARSAQRSQSFIGVYVLRDRRLMEKVRDAARECEERLALVSGRGGAVVVSRATVGLAAVLRALGVPRGSEVVMPVMCCANVVHA